MRVQQCLESVVIEGYEAHGIEAKIKDDIDENLASHLPKQ
jgi:hypothetical protein